MKHIDGLRDFTQDDYPLLTELFDAVLPEYPNLGEEQRRDDGHIKPPAKMKRWLVIREGKAAAMVDYHQHNRMFHPRKFFVEIDVHPEWRGQGLGKAIYEFVLKQLEPLNPWLIRIEAREDHDDSTHLLEGHQYRRVQRWEEWRLNIKTFESEPFEADVRKVLDEDLRFASLAELSVDPQWRRRLFDFRIPLLEDVTSLDARTPPTFEEFEERYFGNPHFAAEGVFIALHGERWVALTELSFSDDPAELSVGLTAVDSAWRGKGLATAIKVHALKWAGGTGREHVVTWVEQHNNPMLGINRRLGFEPRPAWVTWEKEVGEAPDEE